MKQPPLSLYVHLPWCVRKCPYCDFYSIESDEEDLDSREAFVNALISEIKNSSIKETGISTIYIGGGTPSMLEGEQVDRILSCLRDKFDLTSVPEITLEFLANPMPVLFECDSQRARGPPPNHDAQTAEDHRPKHHDPEPHELLPDRTPNDDRELSWWFDEVPITRIVAQLVHQIARRQVTRVVRTLYSVL